MMDRYIATNSTTLLENITSQLPPERKDQFFDLFRQLQVRQTRSHFSTMYSTS